jgi:hypothetical protein
MRIDNPTLAHFRHFSSLFTHLPSTSVENPLQISYFLCKTNPIFSAVGGFQMNVSNIITRNYKYFIPLAGQKNKPNSNPVKPNLSQFRCQSNPKQTQFKPKQTQFQTAGKRTIEAQKKKRVSGIFLRFWFAEKIDFLDGCDILYLWEI